MILELFIFAASFGVSGYFYTRVGHVLLTGRQNSRNRTLTVAFMALWVSWGMCAVPNLVFNACFRLLSQYGVYFLPSDVNIQISFGDEPWDIWSQLIVFGDIAVRALRHSYSFINSILLIILLRPFQRPLQFPIQFARVVCERLSWVRQPRK